MNMEQMLKASKRLMKRYALALALAGTAGMAHAVVVNVDFESGAPDTYSDVGVAPDAGTVWNNLGPGANNAPLNDSSGAASPVSVSITGDVYDYENDGGGTVNNLLRDYLYCWYSVGTVNLAGLTPNAAFDLYLYGQGDNPDQNSLFTLTVGNGAAFGASPPSDRTAMANTYVKLSGIADGSGNVSFIWEAARPEEGGGYAGFNGFQLDLNPPVDVTPPTLVSFEHDKGAGPIRINEPVTYTVTFSEAMLASTVNAADFGNTTSTVVTVNSVTPTADPAVFTVVVTPTEAGLLQLQIIAGATLTDLATLALVTTSALPDDSILIVQDIPKTPTSITVVSSGTPTTYGQNVSFTATVSPTPSGGTVQFKDGGIALGSPVTVNTGTGEAAYSSSALGAATHQITAEFSGNFAYEPSTTTEPISHGVDKASLTVTAVDAFRPTQTANPDPFTYTITGFQNGENLATSGVTGTPDLTTTAVLLSSPGDYTITCAVGSLAASNYSFTFSDGTLTVAEVEDIFSVNFYSYGGLSTEEQYANVRIAPGMPAGMSGWYASGWLNVEAPWGGGLQTPQTLTSTKGTSATFTFKNCRNGGTYSDGPRNTLLGDGNGNLMDGHVNSTLLDDVPNHLFDMEVTDITFPVYDVIFYLGANQAQFGDGKGAIVFNGVERGFTLKPGAFDGTFIEMVDENTEGNYIVYKDVTGSSFTAQTWGTGIADGRTGFVHVGPFGFQIKDATPKGTVIRIY
jgi:hypothetical protein